MIEQLINWDLKTFVQINSSYTNILLDYLCPFFRNKYSWFPLYAFLISFLLLNYRRKGWVIVLFLFLTVFVADKMASDIIKPWVERLRPCNDPFLKEFVRSLVRCGPGYSFPSTHATNHFAVAAFLIVLFYTKWKWILPVAFLWSFAISYSQVYVGLHYPVDVIAGSILGSIIGISIALLTQRVVRLEEWNSR